MICSFNMKCTFFNSFILSKIDYCANIWGGAYNQAMDNQYFKDAETTCNGSS